MTTTAAKKNVLVTGGTRGIGAATAKAFQQEGHAVWVTYNANHDAASAFQKETGMTPISFDLSDLDRFDDHWQRFQGAVGEDLDIVVANAGVTQDASFRKMTRAQWQWVMTTNLSSVFYLAQAVMPSMRQNQWGRFIAVSSVNAFSGQRGQVNYAASKAGLLGFVRSLAREVGRDNVTVNALAPGYTETDMTAVVSEAVRETIQKQIPLGRFGLAEEVAQAAVFLASEKSAYITGSTLHINGGLWMGG